MSRICGISQDKWVSVRITDSSYGIFKIMCRMMRPGKHLQTATIYKRLYFVLVLFSTDEHFRNVRPEGNYRQSCST